ncbi:type II inositol-1,4,5-trisphosphate 5-phosphatase [Biscogniauxia mediterranea]|nr:type II inositol-1,4,5-trisphosphate 5-phosphatase [Biscogniauxia mediterranea]
MSTSNRDPSIDTTSEPVDLAAATHYSLSRAVGARKSEYVRPHRIRIKVGTWNVANCPGTDKDLANWFIGSDELKSSSDAKIANLSLSESETIGDESSSCKLGSKTASNSSTLGGDEQASSGEGEGAEAEPTVKSMAGDKIGLYVLGLQEIVGLNMVHQSFYSDPSTIAKWQDALEAALPKGYTLVACQQLIGLLLLVYASPEVAPTISNESTIAVGTGLLGYMGNKGAITSRLILGETTRLVFINCHLASGHDQASLDRRCWDYNKIVSQTKFAPVSHFGVEEEDEEKLGEEDFAFFFGDLNFRLDGLPGGDIRRLLMLHARGEYDVSQADTHDRVGDDGVIVLHNNDDGDDSDGTRTPEMISREASFDKDDNDDEDDDDTELPDPDDFLPDPHDDPASLQATLDSLLPHDQLRRLIKQRRAFHEGWEEGPITFLPTYKYDVGTVGLFDSSEKKRAPSWCDRILYRTRTDLEAYERKCKDEIESKKKDEDMKSLGIEQAAEDESILFDYDPSADSSAENLAPSEPSYEYDEYDDTADQQEHEVVTKDGFTDRIELESYTSHQRTMSSDHKPVVAIFTLTYDAVVPELKAKVHAEVARELDRAENEGRPCITIVVDGRESTGTQNLLATEGGEIVDFGDVGFLQKRTRSLTIANTGRVSAHISFVEKPNISNDATQKHEWLEFRFIRSSGEDDSDKQDPLGDEITLEPGETVTAIIQIEVHSLTQVQTLNAERTQLEDVLVLRVADGRDHFVPIRATWRPSCFGRSLEELIRLPRGGIRALVKERQMGGPIPDSLDVHRSSPMELLKITEAVESLAERVIADENMLEDCKVPRDNPGWPFDPLSLKTKAEKDYDELRYAIIEALEEDKPLLDTLTADVPAIKRLEILSDVLLLFLHSMTDGIITAPLWAQIEEALPNVANAKTPAEFEEVKTVVLDILSTSPHHNISFVFLTSMLTRVANELLPLSKQELDALSMRGSRSGAAATLGRSLSFRRGAAATPVINTGAVQRRAAWEKKAAEIIGGAMCRTSRSGGSSNAKERKMSEDRVRAVVEVFLRRDGA